MTSILSGGESEVTVGAFLMALRWKGRHGGGADRLRPGSALRPASPVATCRGSSRSVRPTMVRRTTRPSTPSPAIASAAGGARADGHRSRRAAAPRSDGRERARGPRPLDDLGPERGRGLGGEGRLRLPRGHGDAPWPPARAASARTSSCGPRSRLSRSCSRRPTAPWCWVPWGDRSSGPRSRSSRPWVIRAAWPCRAWMEASSLGWRAGREASASRTATWSRWSWSPRTSGWSTTRSPSCPCTDRPRTTRGRATTPPSWRPRRPWRAASSRGTAAWRAMPPCSPRR